MSKRVVAGAISLAAIMAAAAMSQTATTGAVAKPAANVARGKYLVVNVGNCGFCHTPLDKKGQPIKTEALQGAPLMFKPTIPIAGWMPVAPAIAGLPGWTDEQGVEFFTTGKKPDGSMAAPPMPSFRFNNADAAAVVAYLKTLK